jgi:hypothetical protein
LVLFFSCPVGLSLKITNILEIVEKILRPTTVISWGTMQKDWEGSD